MAQTKTWAKYSAMLIVTFENDKLFQWNQTASKQEKKKKITIRGKVSLFQTGKNPWAPRQRTALKYEKTLTFTSLPYGSWSVVPIISKKKPVFRGLPSDQVRIDWNTWQFIWKQVKTFIWNWERSFPLGTSLLLSHKLLVSEN